MFPRYHPTLGEKNIEALLHSQSDLIRRLEEANKALMEEISLLKKELQISRKRISDSGAKITGGESITSSIVFGSWLKMAEQLFRFVGTTPDFRFLENYEAPMSGNDFVSLIFSQDLVNTHCEFQSTLKLKMTTTGNQKQKASLLAQKQLREAQNN
jgi:hypothetical protein